ncbi:MAG: 3-deoxy-D-manno-octulosonate 8-phosphate phosphatase [Pseudomonadota bacterium]|jgi:3-deoxy-D-manno-octulosonate 8-phosphate phosphatase (KDO 8-P phosphatase)
MDAIARAKPLKLMAFDVDGVLTDGTLYFTSQGDEMKAFNSLDGHGIKMLMQAGLTVAIISGRRSRSLELRAQNLGITHLHQGVEDKRVVMKALLAELGLTADAAGYMGDDVVDLPILKLCGFSATVADGHDFVKAHVDYVAKKGGGRGAVREVCDVILGAQGTLADMLGAYLAPQG